MDTNTVIKPKNNDLLDLVKLILAFMVVAIHTGLFDPVLYPWLRLAVPLFFIISSYLFFTKVNGCENGREKLSALKSFVLRNLMLYAFWFVVQFPINIFTRGWFEGGFWNGILTLIKSFLLGSTFTASWFIMALIIGTAVIFFASKKVNNQVLFAIGLVLYALISIRSSYMFLFKDVEGLHSVLVGVVEYEAVMNSPINSFPAGIFWIICGKTFADGGFRIKIKMGIAVLLSSCALLFTEWFLIMHFSGNYNKDFYMLLAPCAIVIFSILIQLKPIHLKHAKEMRKMSIIVYASHGTVLAVIQKGLNLTFGAYIPDTFESVIKFILVSGICIGGALLIFLLEKKKYTAWLKYSH